MSRFEGGDTNHNMKKNKNKADVFGFCYSALIIHALTNNKVIFITSVVTCVTASGLHFKHA